MACIPQDSALGVFGPVYSRTFRRWTNIAHEIGCRGINKSDKPLFERFEKMLEFYHCINDLCSALRSALLSWVSKAILCADPLKQGCSLLQLAILSWLISMAVTWVVKPSYVRSSCTLACRKLSIFKTAQVRPSEILTVISGEEEVSNPHQAYCLRMHLFLCSGENASVSLLWQGVNRDPFAVR